MIGTAQSTERTEEQTGQQQPRYINPLAPSSTNIVNEGPVSRQDRLNAETLWISKEKEQEIVKEVEAELEMMIRAIEARIKDQPENDKFRQEKEQIQKIQEEVKNEKDKFKAIQDGYKELTISDNSAYREMMDLKDLAMAASSKGASKEQLDQFKMKAEGYLKELQSVNPKEVSDESINQVVGEIKQDVKKKEDGKNLKLNFWEKLLINIQLVIFKKDTTWLFDQLKKNRKFNGNIQAVLEYMRSNYQNVIKADPLSFKAIEEKHEPLPPPTEEVKNEPVTLETLATTEKEKTSEQTTPEQIETPAKTLRMGKNDIETFFRSKKESKIDITGISNEVIDRLVENESTKSTPRDKIRYTIRLISDQMISKNIPYTKDQIDKVFEAILSSDKIKGLDESKDTAMFKFAKESLKGLIDKRKAESNTLIDWYQEARLKAAGEARKNPDTDKEAIIRKEITHKFVGAIIKDQINWKDENGLNPFDRRANANSYTQDETIKILGEAIETGAIYIEFYERSDNRRWPVLKVNGFDRKNRDIVENIGSDILMKLINGEDAKAFEPAHEDQRQQAPTGLFVNMDRTDGKAPSLIVVNEAKIREKAAEANLSGYKIDELIDHEANHAANKGERIIRESILTNYLKNRTLRIRDQSINPYPDEKMPQKDPKWIKELVENEKIKKVIEELDPQLQEDEIIERTKIYLFQFIQGNEEVPEELEILFEDERISKTASVLKEHYHSIKEELIGTQLEQVTSEAHDMTAPLTLGKLDIDVSKIDQNGLDDQNGAILGMMRLFNKIWANEDSSSFIDQKSEHNNQREVLATYLSSYFYDNKPSLNELIELLNTARENKEHVLHEIVSSFGSEADMMNLLTGSIKEEEIGAYFKRTGKYQESNNISELRWTATRHKDAFYYGKHGTAGRMGPGSLGQKLDIFSPVAWLHTKDKGPGAIQMLSQALNKKNWMDGFGLGLNRFKMDNSDGLEAISFVTGIPVHRLPFLQNLPNWLKDKTGGVIDLDQRAWAPKGTFLATPDMYVYYTQKVIYTRLIKEHKLDNQSLIKLLPEIGGYDYDASGQPTEQVASYSTRTDQYRLNSQLAAFIENVLMKEEYHDPERNIKGDIKTTRNKEGKLEKVALLKKERDDLKEIAERLKQDEIWFNGKMRTVVERGGYIITKELADTLKDDNIETYKSQIEKLAQEEKKTNIVQRGSLLMGQMSSNAMKEILEMMFIPPTKLNDKVKNPWGMAALKNQSNLRDSAGNSKKVAAYQKIGELMMMEDARRRENGEGNYTFFDLYNEMQRSQNQRWPEIFENGKENPDAIERFENPKMIIGDSFVDLGTVKEFFKDFSMARTNKVLSVGVWGKEANYTDDSENLFNTNKGFAVEDEKGKEMPIRFSQIKSLWSSGKGIDFLDKGGFKQIEAEEHPEGIKGYYFIRKEGDKDELYFLEMSQRMYGEIPKSLRKVKDFKSRYSKDAKLEIENKSTGYNLEIDPIKNLSRNELLRYFGERSKHNIKYLKDGNLVEEEINARDFYDTQYGCMFDDVYDELDKIKQGRELSYKFSIKMNQISNYREHSKVHREFYEGLLMIENTTRNLIIGATIIGILVPSLTFLANPYLLLATIGSALTLNPILNRYAKGWGAREIAAIQEQNSLNEMAGVFWKLADETHPPTYGELDIARSIFEGVKYKYRSVLKNFGDAQYNTNVWTGLFGDLWGKVSAKPF